MQLHKSRTSTKIRYNIFFRSEAPLQETLSVCQSVCLDTISFHNDTLPFLENDKFYYSEWLINFSGKQNPPLPWHAHNMFTICLRHIHNMFTTCLPHVHGMFMTCSQHVHDMSMTCSQHVHEMFCLQHVYYMFDMLMFSVFSSLKSSVNCLNTKDKIFSPMDNDRPCFARNLSRRLLNKCFKKCLI